MATTWIKPIHGSETKTIRTIIFDRLDYAENEKKTNEKELVSAYSCNAETADIEFCLTKTMYEKVTGKQSKGKDDVLAYHIRQAFKPGEITAEKAHEIGEQLASKFTKGKHEFVVSTHIDKSHIHNHIIFNSTQIDATHKFNNEWNTAGKIRNISDYLCKENELSVVETLNEKGKHYKEWQEDKKGTSWKTKLKDTMDKLIVSAKSYEDFLKLMQRHGYEVKQGKYVSFKAPGQERFTRAKTIGNDYTEENIIKRIQESVLNKDHRNANISMSENKIIDNKLDITINKKLVIKENNNSYLTRIPFTQDYIWIDKNNSVWVKPDVTLLIHLQEVEYQVYDRTGKQIKEKSGMEIYKNYDEVCKKKNVNIDNSTITMEQGIYTRPAMKLDKKLMYLHRKQKLLNVKDLASTLVLLSNENIYKASDFDIKVNELKQRSQDVKDSIKLLENKNSAYRDTAKYLISYDKYLPINMQYQNQSPIKKKAYYKANESELRAFSYAEDKLKSLGVNTDIKSEKVIELVQEQDNQIKKLYQDIRMVDNRINQIKDARQKVNDIVHDNKQLKDSRTKTILREEL